MSWTEVDLAGVSTEMERVPEGEYVMSLLTGAKFNKWQPNKIEVGAKIIEGEYAGRVQYFTYGDPEKTPSMLQAMKRLEQALAKSTGREIQPGEDILSYLNDPEVVGGKFVATIKHREYTDKEGQQQVKADVSLFKVKAVA